MKRNNPIFFLLLGGLFFFSVPTTSSATPASWKIFLLHSYEQDHICGQPQHEGVLAALQQAGYRPDENIRLQTYYMDTKRRNNTPALIEEQARLALARIRDFQPHILVTFDDNAFRTVALQLVDVPGLQIVFSGMNRQPEDYSQQKPFLHSRKHPGHNITGVYEKLHIVDAIKIQKRIFPGLQKIRMLCDLSPTGKALKRQVELELAQHDLPVAFDTKIVRNWEEYRKEIRALDQSEEIGTIYPVALLLKDEAGKTYTAPEIFRWTIAHCRKPAIALNYAFTSLGLFGGAAVDFKAMGQQAGELIVQILQGTPAGELSVEEAERYALVFNLNRAQQLEIEIPEDILLAADEIIYSPEK